MPIHLPQIPFSEPVLIFALAMGIFLIVPLLFERIRVPGLIGLIVVGAAVGPNGLGLLARDETIVLLGTVGLLYLMFLVGLELDLNEFTRHRNHSIVFGFLSFALPQVTGTALSLMLGYSLPASILLGAMFASHTLVAYPIASRLGIVKTRAVTTVLGATLITDMLALLVLAIVSGSREGAIGVLFWLELLGMLGVYVALVLWVVPRIGSWFFRNVSSAGPAEYVFVLAMLFVFAYLAHAMGIEPIIGALLTGFALNRLIPEHSTLLNRIKFVADSIFVPFFLLSVGMLVDVRAFADREAWFTIAALVFATVVSKSIAAKVTERIFGYDPEDGWVMFGLSVSHAAATMAITLVGYQIGLFDETIVNAIVVIILVTCLIGPAMVERYGKAVALREEQKPYEPSTAPQRILIPISNPATADALLDIAVMLRGTRSEEPLYPLMVVTDGEDDAEAKVAEAEKMLGHAVIYAAGAEVPVAPLTRVDRNIASGIVRGIAETRTTTVVVGWDGRTTARELIFGSVLDQLLEQTRQLTVVAKLGHPLNVTRRLVVVAPPAIDHHPGFFGAVQAVKTIAGELGANLVGLVVTDDSDRYESLFAQVRPEVPLSFHTVARWRHLLGDLGARLRVDDLVVLLSARRGSLGWHRELERLPTDLAHLGPESFLIVYPSEVETPARRDFSGTILPGALRPERVIFNMPDVVFARALDMLLRSEFADDLPRLRRISSVLVEHEHEFSTQISPGVIVPHARIEGLPEPMIFLGISPEGIELSDSDQPANLVFLMLSPLESPDEHLRNLAGIARLVSSPQRVEALVQSRTVEDLFEAFGAGGRSSAGAPATPL